MKHILLSTLFSLFAISLYAQPVSIPIVKTGTDGGVDVSSDDAEQENNAMDKLYDDDLDAGWEGDDFNTLTMGLRFQNVNIPQGANIDSAYVKVWSHEEENDLAKITIWGEAADNPGTFDLTNLITDRTYTTSSVAWDESSTWAIWTEYRTPDISTVVQEIVNRTGWASGNSLVLIFAGEDQGASADDNARDMESFENEEDPSDGGDGQNHPERAPRLIVYYDGLTSGTSENNLRGLKVFPNPAKDVFQISLGHHNAADYSLFDILGNKVMEGQLVGHENIDISGLDRGMYLIEIADQDELSTRKLIVE